MNFSDAITRALRNISKHGDTDIFPFPFETHLFFDREADCKAILEAIHADFDSTLSTRPPAAMPSLTQVGYTGFRWANQIEPFWNSYYLPCVIALAKLFKDSTWTDYRHRGLELSNDAKFVVVTDIADFYPRIYHHRIENALNRLPHPDG